MALKTYTFKIKLFYADEKHPAILSLVHCPLEVFYNSVKEFKELEELYNTLMKPDNKEVPYIYVTASDYLANDGVDYVSTDYVLCDYKTILESNSLIELLRHPNFYGFLDANSLVQLHHKEFYKKRRKTFLTEVCGGKKSEV